MTVMIRPLSTSDTTTRVLQTLCASGYSDLRSVEVSLIADVLHLQGTVRSYYLKQVAQSLALSTDGVTGIDNQLVVQ